MKGLIPPPSTTDCHTAIRDLETNTGALIGIGKLALYSQWSRFEPRIAETWIDCVVQNWPKYNPMELRQELLRMPWPEAAGALLEFVVEHKRLSDHLRFGYWKKIVIFEFKLAPFELFYIGLFPFGGNMGFKEALNRHRKFDKWGYFSSCSPVPDKKQNKIRTGMSKSVREARLNQWIEIRRGGPTYLQSFHAKDYSEYLGTFVHPKTIERDLANHPHLVAMGNSKARVYRIKGRHK